ncbi:nicotinate-nucleotide adenylyltransferase [Bacillus dakarensis]|uniref:nicotinate-nucleotide adenylyltransferase n=1 Tax=Robertmurraya dakarensis TaxID=1926278 RepID=UPI0009819561|nr:nicotinate-nucleotide adenylyltransferase [Bacillus dakarensis]
MKNIGILGGTFDPPHYGHLLMANEVLHGLNLDEIWFMPNQEPPHKEKSDQIRNEDRLEMLELAIKDEPRFRVEKIEFERPGPSYTYDTVKLLLELYPDVTFYFIIGADMIEYLPKWYKIEELMELLTFVGVDRPNYEHETPYPIIYVDVPEFAVSSSLIRERVREGKTVKYLLPDTVIQYLKENRLYGSK